MCRQGFWEVWDLGKAGAPGRAGGAWKVGGPGRAGTLWTTAPRLGSSQWGGLW